MNDERTPEVPHHSIRQLLIHFQYKHLPEHLQHVSEPFYRLAHACAFELSGPEVTVGLRKLLEAKDCMVRAAVVEHDTEGTR